MTWLAGIIVVASALYLLGLAVLALAAPRRAERFLAGFAASARAHYTEQILRLAAGFGIVAYSPQMQFSNLFWIFGWIILATTVGLLLVPWRWHHRFGKWAIPLAIRHIKLYALGAFALGVFILYAAWTR